MPKVIDLTGQKFNYLTVIGRAPNKSSHTMWECECECGNITIVSGSNLSSGSVKSCGCRRFSVLSEQFTKNEIGNRFGRLVAVEIIRRPRKLYLGKKNGIKVYYRCVCDCGQETIVWGAHLRNGSIQSCGCLKKEILRTNRITHGLSDTKEYNSAKTRRRKEHKKLLDSTWTTEMELYLRQLFAECVVCGMTEQEHLEEFGTSLHVDHVYPLASGNGLKPGNATILCTHCNSTKQHKNPEDLPERMRSRILATAEIFELLWNGRS